MPIMRPLAGEIYYFQTLIVIPGHFKDPYVCVGMCV